VERMEMEAKDWITLVSVLTTLLIFIVTLIVNRRKDSLQKSRDDALRKEQQAREDNLRREQQGREDRLREEQQKREDMRQEKERTHQPRIELDIDCTFYGPEKDSYIVEIFLTAQNQGLIQQKFERMILRVRGIESNQELTYFPGYEPRLNFPIKLLDNVSVIPKGYGYYFVEPSAKQTITYITKIPSSIKYILAHAVFWYDEETSHVTEKVFPVITR
jgi:hypothetical protein